MLYFINCISLSQWYQGCHDNMHALQISRFPWWEVRTMVETMLTQSYLHCGETNDYWGIRPTPYSAPLSYSSWVIESATYPHIKMHIMGKRLSLFSTHRMENKCYSCPVQSPIQFPLPICGFIGKHYLCSCTHTNNHVH